MFDALNLLLFYVIHVWNLYDPSHTQRHGAEVSGKQIILKKYLVFPTKWWEKASKSSRFV